MPADSLRVGNVEIITLTDYEGALPFTLDQIFPGVALEQWEPYRKRYPRAFPTPDTWGPHFGGMAVRSEGRLILVDTGAGPEPIPLLGGFEGKLVGNMKARGVDPADVDIVFMTHAHIDHIGWNMASDGRPTFPNARYVLHTADWAAAKDLEAFIMQFGAGPYVDRALAPLEALGVLDLTDGDRALTGEVTAIATPGHTPGHMCVLISSGGEKALIPGDAIVHPALVTEPGWHFGFDNDQEQAIVTRSGLLDRIEADGMTLATCHFPHPGFGKVVRLEGRRYWQPV